MKNNVSKFKEITAEMEILYTLKNTNYGDSFSEQFKEYGLTSLCIRLDDKIRRLKSINKQLQNKETVDLDDESVRDTLIDLANYSILGIMELDK